MNLPRARALYEDDGPSQAAMSKALAANADEIARLAEALRAAEASIEELAKHKYAADMRIALQDSQIIDLREELDAARAEIADARRILKCPENFTLAEWCQASQDDYAKTDEIMRRADAAREDAERLAVAIATVLPLVEFATQASEKLHRKFSAAVDALAAHRAQVKK